MRRILRIDAIVLVITLLALTMLVVSLSAQRDFAALAFAGASAASTLTLHRMAGRP